MVAWRGEMPVRSLCVAKGAGGKPRGEGRQAWVLKEAGAWGKYHGVSVVAETA